LNRLSRAYEIVAPWSVYDELKAVRPAIRREIGHFLHRLCRETDLTGNFEASADDGRIHQVKVFGNWMVSWWVDHPMREVRLTTIERVE
jgi:hypothetical protein